MSGDAPKLPLFDIRLADEDVEAVTEALRSGWLTMGPRTQRFEEEFAEHLGVRHAIAVTNGTAALHLAYLAAGIGPGDEVVVPAITFVATANAVRYCGAEPVPADVLGDHDLSLDPDDVRARLSSRTKAVCCMHYGGYAAPVGALRELCDEHGIVLIEDAAHAPASSAGDDARPLGTWGLAGAFSFFSNKVLGCGEGGLVATDDDAAAELVTRLRSHGMTSGTWDRHRGHSAGYDVVGLGFNYRMDEPRAALLTSRLSRLDEDVSARRRLVARYRERLSGLGGLTIPYPAESVEQSSCYVMPVMVERAELRDAVRRTMLEDFGVQTSVLYPALHEFSAYAGSAPGGLPRSERVARCELTLPLFPHMTDEQQDLAVEALASALERAA
ncbi:MAG TPA: DegT/DnrJ/EryC1/StrS family aminotransferase [Thermoleophilaceae bacterium]|nr:DegT/DnrJ/EryC1/StrS family aminotransferase [Thermoleophilaceae bacterium]